MPRPVFEIAMTGTPDCCATGCAPAATAESVGPRIAATLSCSMNLRNAVMPWSRADPSSSMMSCSFAPLIPPALLICSAEMAAPPEIRNEFPSASVTLPRST